MITGSLPILLELRARICDEEAARQVRTARATAREWARCRRLARAGSLVAEELLPAWHDQIAHHLERARSARILAASARDEVRRCLEAA